jgi:putative pyruvate formate lyase activating enzyme
MLHHWEEPPISGTAAAGGAGAVFFAGCPLHCLFCQNAAISQQKPPVGEAVSPERLCEIFWELHAQGAHNIDLVTPGQYLPAVRRAAALAKAGGFPLPLLWNSSGYESAKAIQTLDGLMDIYLPDLKYADDALALRYSAAPNYFAVATAAIAEMHRQVGNPQLGAGGLLQRGLLIRHMVLPGCRRDSMRVLDWIAQNLPGAWVSLLAQYTPLHRAKEVPQLNRRLTQFEYQSVVEHFFAIGLKNGYMQECAAASAKYVPVF